MVKPSESFIQKILPKIFKFMSLKKVVSEAWAVLLVGQVICHPLNVNKALRPKSLFRATWKAYIKLDNPVY